MVELIVKIAYLTCSLLIKSSTQLFCIERLLYISSLTSVHSFKLYLQYLHRSWWSSGMIPEKVKWV